MDIWSVIKIAPGKFLGMERCASRRNATKILITLDVTEIGIPQKAKNMHESKSNGEYVSVDEAVCGIKEFGKE